MPHVAVIDAGSSSSRLFIYKWDNAIPVNGADRYKPVEIKSLGGKESESVGIHTKNTLPGMTAYLRPLLIQGVRQLTVDGMTTAGAVPLYVMATAGVRGSGDQDHQTSIMRRAWDAIHTLRNDVDGAEVFNDGALGGGGVNDDMKDMHSFVVPQKHEGVYAWIALNYGRYQPDQMPGILELGGQSMQIAFADLPPLADAADDFEKVCLFNSRHSVKALSWELGANKARLEASEVKLITGAPAAPPEIFNPCLPHHQRHDIGPDGGKRPSVGSGDFRKCLALAHSYLDTTLDSPLPALDIEPFTKRFYGMSSFWYTYEFFSRGGKYNKHDPYDPQLFRLAVEEYCNGSWLQPFRWNEGRERADRFIANNCFSAAWMMALFHGRKGFNLRLSEHETWKGLVRFPSTPELGSRSSWTIGVATMVARNGDPKLFCRADERDIDIYPPVAAANSAHNGTAPLHIPSAIPVRSSLAAYSTQAPSISVELSQPLHAASSVASNLLSGISRPAPPCLEGVLYGFLLFALVAIGYRRFSAHRTAARAPVLGEKPTEIDVQPVMFRVRRAFKWEKGDGTIPLASGEKASIA